MARVFLSHASSDKATVRRIAKALSAAGHDTWFDEEKVLVGESIPAAVERGLRDAAFVVICLSKAAADRGWVEAERDATLMQQLRVRKERILPVRLEDVTPPYLIGSLAYVDLFPDERAFAEGIARLTRSIEAHEARRDGDANGAARTHAPASTRPIVGEATASRPTAGWVVPPIPMYVSAEVQALSERLEDARARKQNLRALGIVTDEVDREILQLRRQLREGGQLRAGDALGDGRYLLARPVGRGGFAVVWEAFDRIEQRRVAIKVLHQHLAGDPQRRERFFRGARVMMELQHPAVVRIYDPRGEEEAFCYFVMEFVPGGDLRDAVLGHRLEAGRQLPLILQIAEAVAEAHRKGLIHRDIKPANILLDEDGNAKLTDFDLVGAHDTTGGTRTGALGTVVYAAPECLDKPQEATARADVFGLGMTAIFCLAGVELSRAILRDAEPTIAGLSCSNGLKDVLRRAVAWEAGDRFADAAAVAAAVQSVLAFPTPDEPVIQTLDLERLERYEQRHIAEHSDLGDYDLGEVSPAPRRGNVLATGKAALIGAIAIVVGGGAIVYAVTRTAVGMSETQSVALASAVDMLDSGIRAKRAEVHGRAATLSEIPTLRRAIYTDAATVIDFVRGEMGGEFGFLDKGKRNVEIIEIGGVNRDTNAVESWLLLPKGSPRMSHDGVPGVYLGLVGDQIMITEVAKVVPERDAAPAGFLSITRWLALAPVIQALSFAGLDGKLVIDGAEVAIGHIPAGAVTRKQPLASQDGAQLIVAEPPPRDVTPVMVLVGGTIAFVVGLFLLLAVMSATLAARLTPSRR